MVTKQHIKIDDFLKDLDENEISYIEQEVLGAMEDSIFMVLQEAKEMGAYKKFLVDNKLEEGEYKMVLKEPDDDDEEDEKVSSPITTKKSLSSQKLTMEFDPIQSLYNSIAELSGHSQSATPQQVASLKRRNNVFSNSYDINMEEDEDFKPPVYPKTKEEKDFILSALKTNLLTSRLKVDELRVIVEAMFSRVYKAGEVIIESGTEGTEYYIVQIGETECVVKDTYIPKTKILGQGIGFGELALMYNSKRSANITALNETKLWVLDRKTFRHVLMTMSLKNRTLQLSFIDKVSLFNQFTNYERVKLLDSIEAQEVPLGEYLFKEGDLGTNFYIIQDGEVDLLKNEKDQELLFKTLRTGDYLGELALINQKPRSLSCRASTNCKLLVLNANTFNRLLGSIQEILKRNMETYTIWKDQFD